MRRVIVLLRGINVSGHNKVPMAELRKSLEEAGFTGVSSYIQSGNIALDSSLDLSEISAQVGALLAETFDVDVPVISLDQVDVTTIIDAAPFAPDLNPAYQLVCFPGNEVDVAGVETLDSDRWPGDVITATKTAVFVSFANGQGKSKLSIQQLERAAGTNLTGRNLRTTERLIDL